MDIEPRLLCFTNTVYGFKILYTSTCHPPFLFLCLPHCAQCQLKPEYQLLNHIISTCESRPPIHSCMLFHLAAWIPPIKELGFVLSALTAINTQNSPRCHAASTRWNRHASRIPSDTHSITNHSIHRLVAEKGGRLFR